MSNIIYLKLQMHDEILSMCKIVDKTTTLSVFKNDISVFDSNLISIKNKGKFQKATESEFQNFYKKTSKKINKIIEI